jgi:hypothetical protein
MTDAHCRFETELGYLPVQEIRGIPKRRLGKSKQIPPEFWLILGDLGMRPIIDSNSVPTTEGFALSRYTASALLPFSRYPVT